MAGAAAKNVPLNQSVYSPNPLYYIFTFLVRKCGLGTEVRNTSKIKKQKKTKKIKKNKKGKSINNKGLMPGDPKAVVPGAVGRRVPVAVRRAHDPRDVVPRAAAKGQTAFIACIILT